MYTLGINAAYHDPAACLVKDGVVLAVAEEERFTHIKHGKRPVPFSAWELPFHAIEFCLRHAGIGLKDVEHVAYSYDPYLLPNHPKTQNSVSLPLLPAKEQVESLAGESAWDPLFFCAKVKAAEEFVGRRPHHLKHRLRRGGGEGPYRWHFVPHH